jgi:hypothetical protein
MVHFLGVDDLRFVKEGANIASHSHNSPTISFFLYLQINSRIATPHQVIRQLFYGMFTPVICG